MGQLIIFPQKINGEDSTEVNRELKTHRIFTCRPWFRSKRFINVICVDPFQICFLHIYKLNRNSHPFCLQRNKKKKCRF